MFDYFGSIAVLPALLLQWNYCYKKKKKLSKCPGGMNTARQMPDLNYKNKTARQNFDVNAN